MDRCEVVELSGDVFDEVWSKVLPQYGPDTTEAARLQLARIVLAAHREGTDASNSEQAVLERMQSALIAARMLRTA